MVVEIILPAMGETMDEGVITCWLANSGDTVAKGQVIAEIESIKAVFELESPSAGVLQIIVPAGETVPILTVIATVIAPDQVQESAQVPESAAPPAVKAESPEPPREFVSPRARRFAGEKQIDLALVKGSGPGGRVEERDVRAYLVSRSRQVSADAAGPPSGMSAIRRIIAQRMSESAHTTAPVTLTAEVDATELVHLREQVKDHVQSRTGESLSYLVLLAKIVAIAMQKCPYMNVRQVGETIQTLDSLNVGIAVDTERGLLVPVLRGVERKDIVALTKELAVLMTKTRSGTIAVSEMEGGSFTITNLGTYGIDAFTPIINLPECSILGVGRIAPRPAVYQGQIAIRQIVVLSLTFDHRIVDGGPAARFLQCIAELVQNPYPLFLD